HSAAVAGTAAAVAAGVTWIALPLHHGMPPAGAATPGVSGRANPALGRDGQLRTPRTSATAQASVLPTASGGTGAGRPTAEVTGAPSSVAASSAGAGPNPSASASASASDSASGTPGVGTL